MKRLKRKGSRGQPAEEQREHRPWQDWSCWQGSCSSCREPEVPSVKECGSPFPLTDREKRRDSQRIQNKMFCLKRGGGRESTAKETKAGDLFIVSAEPSEMERRRGGETLVFKFMTVGEEPDLDSI